MKTFFVKTQSGVNEHRLHSIDAVEFSTDNLERALEVFDNEVAQLAKEYTALGDLSYPISDFDLNRHGVYTSIIAIDDAEPDEVEFIKDSDFFIEEY